MLCKSFDINKKKGQMDDDRGVDHCVVRKVFPIYDKENEFNVVVQIK